MREKICITVYTNNSLYKLAEEYCQIENATPKESPWTPWTIQQAIEVAAKMNLQDWIKGAVAKCFLSYPQPLKLMITLKKRYKFSF